MDEENNKHGLSNIDEGGLDSDSDSFSMVDSIPINLDSSSSFYEDFFLYNKEKIKKENEDSNEEDFDSLDEISDDDSLNNSNSLDKISNNNNLNNKNNFFKTGIKTEDNSNSILGEKIDYNKEQLDEKKTEKKPNKIDNIPLFMLMNGLIQKIKYTYIFENMYAILDPKKISMDKNYNIVLEDCTNNLNKNYLYNLSDDSICYTAPELLRYMCNQQDSRAIDRKNIVFSLGLFLFDELSNNTYLETIKNMFDEECKKNPRSFLDDKLELPAYLMCLNRFLKRDKLVVKKNGILFPLEKNKKTMEEEIDIKNLSNFLPKNILENEANKQIIEELQKKLLDMVKNTLSSTLSFYSYRSTIFELEEEFNEIFKFMLDNLKREDGSNITVDDILFFGINNLSNDSRIKNKILYGMKIFTEDNIKIVRDELRDNVDNLLLSKEENSNIKEFLEVLKNCIEENGDIRILNDNFYNKLKEIKLSKEEKNKIIEILIKLKELKIASVISKLESFKKDVKSSELEYSDERVKEFIISSKLKYLDEKIEELKKLYINISLSTVVNIKFNESEFEYSYEKRKKIKDSSIENEKRLQNIKEEINDICLKSDKKIINSAFEEVLKNKDLSLISVLIDNKVIKLSELSDKNMKIKCIDIISNSNNSKIIGNLLDEIKNDEELYSIGVRKFFDKASIKNNNEIVDKLLENIKQNINIFDSETLFKQLFGLFIGFYENGKYVTEINNFISSLQNDKFLNEFFEMVCLIDQTDLVNELIKNNRVKISNEIIIKLIKNKKIKTAKLLLKHYIDTKETITKEKKIRRRIEERIKITEEDKNLFNNVINTFKELAKDSLEKNKKLNNAVKNLEKDAIKFSEKKYYYIVKNSDNSNEFYDLLDSLESAIKNISTDNTKKIEGTDINQH